MGSAQFDNKSLVFGIYYSRGEILHLEVCFNQIFMKNTRYFDASLPGIYKAKY
jgi:hypothetical protein